MQAAGVGAAIPGMFEGNRADRVVYHSLSQVPTEAALKLDNGQLGT